MVVKCGRIKLQSNHKRPGSDDRIVLGKNITFFVYFLEGEMYFLVHSLYPRFLLRS